MLTQPNSLPPSERHIQRALARLRPALNAHLRKFARQQPAAWADFNRRLDQHFPRLFTLLLDLYGQQYDFFYHLGELLKVMATAWAERSSELRTLDQAREAAPLWFESNQMLGGVCYVDLFAGNLEGIRARIPYFRELGLTYLHLMPLFQVPSGENDGGYAISSYREVAPRLGSMAELRQLAADLRREGISLVLDFVFNHTADDHAWARQARQGDPDYREYYRFYPDRTLPDQYERTLREIFPDEHPGAFTYFPDLDQWVWTTFHSYQWDLNYANPELFNRMAGEMLYLANQGIEILRLDAVAFIWKQMGTSCENLPGAHLLIQAFNLVARIATPALLFKSEAIVHPDEVVKYIHPQECQLSYNPLLMAMLWNTLATRQIDLLSLALRERFAIPAGSTWVNYVRCHDDIGWTFADEDALRLQINSFDHRRFLNQFFSGRFAGSFARGLPFQENLKTGDMRISGACASLAGLEKGLADADAGEIDLAIRRILLIHGLILSVGGIPLLYLGDEVGVLNDYSYRTDPDKWRDSRWVHRPVTDWERMEQRSDPTSIPGQIYRGLRHLIAIRKAAPALSGNDLQVMDTENPHVLGFVRTAHGQRMLVFANFSEHPQRLNGNLLRLYGMGYHFTDLVSGATIGISDLEIAPYQLLILE